MRDRFEVCYTGELGVGGRPILVLAAQLGQRPETNNTHMYKFNQRKRKLQLHPTTIYAIDPHFRLCEIGRAINVQFERLNQHFNSEAGKINSFSSNYNPLQPFTTPEEIVFVFICSCINTDCLFRYKLRW